MMLNNVSILAAGTRGDIQPYISIGVALKEAGYNVRVLTNVNHASFVNSFNLIHVPTNPDDTEKNLKTNPHILQAMADGDASTLFAAFGKLIRESAYDNCRNFLAEVKQNRPDLLLIGTLGEYQGLYAEKILKIPTLEVKLQAISYDPKRGPFGIPTMPDGKHWDIMVSMFEGFYSDWKHFDDAMVSLGGSELLSIYSKDSYIADTLGQPRQLHVVCQSPRFRDILYPNSQPNLCLVGACILNRKQQRDHSEKFGGAETHDQIENFLAADKERKPVYLGWGSMVSKSPEHMVKFAVRALQISGQRGIVLGGWAGLSMDSLLKATSNKDLLAYAEENVLFVKEASHENLFPRVACTVHHGGAGTTNAALRSGVPTIITPVFADQWDHAFLVNELGVGVGFSKQMQQTSAEELAEAINLVILDKSIVNRAKEAGKQQLEEDGVRQVVSKVEEHWEAKANKKEIPVWEEQVNMRKIPVAN